MAKEKVNPIVLTDNETGEKYTLEFTRDTVRFAESRGFDISDLEKYPMTKIPDLFYFAFRAHHKFVARDKTDKILFEDLGGMPEGMVEQLGRLYAAPFEALMPEEGERKNAKMTVEF